MASSSPCKPLRSSCTPIPLRFTLKSHDKLTPISMKIRWIDEQDQEQQWNSWEDSLCGRFGATKLLPCRSTDIQVRFRGQPGGRKVHGVDRRRKCAWTKQGEEVVCFRTPGDEDDGRGIDAWFELRGPMTHCNVWRAWNTQNGGQPAAWEHWPDFPAERIMEVPETLKAADSAAPWPGRAVQASSPQSEMPDDEVLATAVAAAMSRLSAAANVLVQTRRGTLRALEDLNSELTKQWYRVNSGNTVAAGLAVASFGALFTAPPVGIALGAGSAAAGVGTTTGDILGESGLSRDLIKVVLTDYAEQLGFETVEAELRTALESAAAVTEKRRMKAASRRRRHVMALAGHCVGVQATGLLAVRSVRAVATARIGAEGLSVAAKVFGGLGAGLAVGVAVHGWSTMKPTQKLVQDKIAEVERSVDYLQTVLQQMAGVLLCPLCKEPLYLDGGSRKSSVRRCSQFHCFHGHCLPEGKADGCPLCPNAAESVSDIASGSERLRALFWLSGLKEFCTVTVDSLSPNLLSKGKRLAEKLAAHAEQDSSGQSRLALLLQRSRSHQGQDLVPSETQRPRPPILLSENAATHEAWQEALEEVHGNPMNLSGDVVDSLLAGSCGMPLKYRHRIWPQWLHAGERRSRAEDGGLTFAGLAADSVPEKVVCTVDADVPRTRQDFVPESQHEILRALLLAIAARRPEVAYAQGMNQLAAVLLKLGFDEESSCWMLESILEDLLPGCHHPDLHGLFRDTAVLDILLQTFLPHHAAVFSQVDVEVLWFSVDYFITLGVSDAPLSLVACLWDLCFLHGARALFCGILAIIELFFPVEQGKGSDPDPEDLMRDYKTSLQEASADGFAARVLNFMHERQGGVSAELVEGLRASLGPSSSGSEISSAKSSPSRSPTAKQGFCPEDLGEPMTE